MTALGSNLTKVPSEAAIEAAARATHVADWVKYDYLIDCAKNNHGASEYQEIYAQIWQSGARTPEEFHNWFLNDDGSKTYGLARSLHLAKLALTAAARVEAPDSAPTAPSDRECIKGLAPFAAAFDANGKVDLSKLDFDHFHRARFLVNAAMEVQGTPLPLDVPISERELLAECIDIMENTMMSLPFATGFENTEAINRCVATVLGINNALPQLRAAIAHPPSTSNENVFTSEDGFFSSTAEEAIKIAYMVNTAEAIVNNDQIIGIGIGDSQIGEIFIRYCDGSITVDEARIEFAEWNAELEASAVKKAAPITKTGD